MNAHVVAAEVKFHEQAGGECMHVACSQVIAGSDLVMHQSFKSSRAGHWLAELSPANPDIIPISKAMIHACVIFILASLDRRAIQAVEVGVAGQIRRREQLLSVFEHAWIDHANRNL